MSIWSVLQRLGVLDPFAVDDVERAEIENALRDHSSVMVLVESTIGQGLIEAQSKLQASIESSRSFSETARRQVPPAEIMRQLARSPGLSSFFPSNHPEI
jgi:hypothetical protein